ncbi:MAG: hypothetical protein KAU14_03760, partial [Thermoplasmata archaeon]|nr:hypothetical protein [Thermoplasmata archaeon]
KHNSVKNLSVASFEHLVIFDNSSDGTFNYLRYQKAAWASLDNNSDGNREFAGVHFEDYLVYRNDTTKQNPSYIKAWTFTGAHWDNNSDGTPDKKYYKAEGFVMVDEDQDGNPEIVWHVKYEGDGEG